MSQKDEMMRTDSTQAMQNLFMAYAEDDEGGEEDTSGPATHFDISGSEDEGTPQPVEKIEKRPVVDVDLIEEEAKKPKLERKRETLSVVACMELSLFF